MSRRYDVTMYTNHNMMIYVTLLLYLSTQIKADLPCVPRFYENRSSVCVCNNTYCDTITREKPSPGMFYVYKSSQAGLRFSKTWGYVEDVDPTLDLATKYDKVYDIQPNRQYQTIEGFGGAVTDSAGMNWKDLPTPAQQLLINSYFGKDGIEYNMIRLPCGSTDFSTRNYTYNEYPKYDSALTNFTLAPEDKLYKLPMIKACKKVATDKIKIVSGVWSPPEWMKAIDNSSDLSTLKKEHYQTYANYMCKFVKLMKKYDIDIWAMTTTNEPLIGFSAGAKREETRFTTPQMVDFVVNHFGPTMRKCVPNLKLLANDDMRFCAILLFDLFSIFSSKASDYIDGIALHFYYDTITPPAAIAYSLRDNPTKFAISTEACIIPTDGPAVPLGSWDNAKTYIYDILENLNYNVRGWIDWNLCLDPQGGPNWIQNFVDSPVIVFKEKQEFVKQPMFYAVGHFSKFLPRNSRRIRIVRQLPVPDPDLDIRDIEAIGQKYFDNVALRTPRKTIVVIIYNDGPAQKAALKLRNKLVSVELNEDSITTVEIPYNGVTLGRL